MTISLFRRVTILAVAVVSTLLLGLTLPVISASPAAAEGAQNELCRPNPTRATRFRARCNRPLVCTTKGMPMLRTGAGLRPPQGICCQPNQEPYPFESITFGPRRGQVVWHCRLPLCPPGQSRNAQGQCVLNPCPNGQVRDGGGVCVTLPPVVQCGNKTCAAGQECVGGKTCSAPRCQTSADCKGGTVCFGNRCTPPTCRGDADCPAGQGCAPGGVCVVLNCGRGPGSYLCTIIQPSGDEVSGCCDDVTQVCGAGLSNGTLAPACR
jgi:hypothetical protein